ncbi:hypothetical protein ABT369_25950 [Dactylosporangium sp. NPDC000244]
MALQAFYDAGLVVAAVHVAAVTHSGDLVGVIFHGDRVNDAC